MQMRKGGCNKMGSIPQYQRDQFASTYVGGAQKDESNALIAGAVQEEAAEPIRKNEIAKLKAREDAITDLQANNAVIQYGLDVQNGLTQLQKDYATNTSAYPSAAVEYSRKLSGEQAKAIPDSRVRTKFEAAAAAVQRQITAPAIEWVKDKNAYNATVAYTDAVRMTALTMGNTTTAEAYILNRQAFVDTDKLATGIVDDKTREKLLKDGHKTAIEAHLFNRVMTDPEALIKSIEADEYDSVPEFTAEIKAEYLTKAKTQIRSDNTAIRIAQTDNAQRLGLKVLAGSATFDEIDAYEKAKDPYAKISLSDSKQLKSSLVRQVKAETVDLVTNHEAAREYVEMLNNFVDDNVDRAKFQQKLIEVWSDGVPSTEESVFLSNLKTNLTDMKVITYRKDVNKAIGGVKAFVTNLWRGNPKVPAENVVADKLKSMIYDISTNGTTPNEAMRTVMSATLMEKFNITESTEIPKEGKPYRNKDGVEIRVFKTVSPKGVTSYSYRRESP